MLLRAARVRRTCRRGFFLTREPYSPKEEFTQDATNFRGRGPIQLTGRYNYQKFADYAGVPDLIAHPGMPSDNMNNPALGFEAAGYFWEVLNGHGLNELADESAGAASVDFATAVTAVINPGLKALDKRLADYRRARSALLTPPSQTPASPDRGLAVEDARGRRQKAERPATALAIVPGSEEEQNSIGYVEMALPATPLSP